MLYGHRLVTRPDRAAERQPLEVHMAVALAVEEADADQRDAEVGGALQVIPGESAEAARVDRDRLVQRARGARRGRARRRPRTARKLAGWPLGGGGRASPRAVRTERGGERRTSHAPPSVAAGVPEPPGSAP